MIIFTSNKYLLDPKTLQKTIQCQNIIQFSIPAKYYSPAKIPIITSLFSMIIHITFHL
jgi:hypothetical protein